MEVISSVQNERVKRAAKLLRRKGRREQSRIIIHGQREVKQALAGGIAIDELFLPQSASSTFDTQFTEDEKAFIHFVAEVGEKAFAKIAFGDRTLEPVATAQTPTTNFSDFADELPENCLIAVVEGIEKPGNFGAILRTADGAGLDAVIAVDGETDVFNPNAIRASLGAIFTIPVCESKCDDLLAWLLETNTLIAAAIVGGKVAWHEVNLTGRTAVVLGSEANGLTDRWRREKVTAVALPMLGAVDSLNVSSTAAILFYEALRQRSNGQQ